MDFKCHNHAVMGVILLFRGIVEGIMIIDHIITNRLISNYLYEYIVWVWGGYIIGISRQP